METKFSGIKEEEICPINVRHFTNDWKDLCSSLELLESAAPNTTAITEVVDENSQNIIEPKPWEKNHFAKNYMIELFTVFYLVILVIYAIMSELSSWLIDKDDKREHEQLRTKSLIFNLYIYIASFLFFGYWYILFVQRKWNIRKLQQRNWKINSSNRHTAKVMSSFIAVINNEITAIKLPNVGSVYLRVGTVVFAILSCVYFAFSAYMDVFIELDVCAVIFTVVQTHFLFYSSMMLDDRHYIITRFGAMHLVAANLITWFQFLFFKYQTTQRSIADHSTRDDLPIIYKSQIFTGDDCLGIECILGSFTKVFYTAVIEYSMIASAVMFIVWHNIERLHNKQLGQLTHKRNQKSVNLSKFVCGIASSFIFVVGTLIALITFFVFYKKFEHYAAALLFNVTDIIQNFVATAACLFALWRLKNCDFQYHNSAVCKNTDHANQELLDSILLAIGLFGELAFSISGLVGLSTTRKWQTLAFVLAIAHVFRIVQSLIQCFLICIASKMKTRNSNEQPGRQTITFLIAANILMFIMNLLASDKAGTCEEIMIFYGEENWVFLVRIFSPITIFFRFHSSVCFAEIWKKIYVP